MLTYTLFHYPSRSITSPNSAMDYSLIASIHSNLYPVPVTTPVATASTKKSTAIKPNAKVSSDKMTNALSELLRSWVCVD